MINDDRLIIFDGACGLCHAWVRFVIRHDKHRVFRFTPMQSDTGQAVLERLGMSRDIFKTLLYVEDNVVYEKSLAFVKIVGFLPWPISMLSYLSVFPRFIRDLVYDRIANHRYKLFGTRDLCLLTDEAGRDRFI